MNRNLFAILFVVIIIGIWGAYKYYISQYLPKYDWYETYDIKSEEPYGLKYFYDLVKKESTHFNEIDQKFYDKLDTNAKNATYFGIGYQIFLDSNKVDHLLKFAKNGNTVFISSNNLPKQILLKFYKESKIPVNYYNYYDGKFIYVHYLDSVNIKLPKDSLKFHYQYAKDTMIYYWKGLNYSYVFDTLKSNFFNPLTQINNDGTSSFSLNYGKGKIIINTTPILFTNYNIIQKQGLINANYYLNYLNKENVYWDEISQFQDFSNFNLGTKNNPLKFLFSHYTLRWAWYLFLITLLLYVLFRSKREQRNILEKDLMKEIIQRSGIKQQIISDLFNLFRKVRFSPIADSKDLIKLHNAIEYFNKNCK